MRLEQKVEGLTIGLQQSNKVMQEMRVRSHEFEVFVLKQFELLNMKNDLLTKLYHGEISIWQIKDKLGGIRANL